MNRRRNQLSPEKLEEIRRYATAPRVKMKLRCGHEGWVPDFTDAATTDCWFCKNGPASFADFTNKSD